MRANSYLEIDLHAIEQNVRQLREEIGPETKLIPVLKGNAYGLGAVRIARFLDSLGGIDSFAVSQVAEGLELRSAGLRQQILVMSLPLEFQLDDALKAELTLTLGGFHQFPLFRALSERSGKRIPVSLKLDTGLHRIGFLPEEAEALCRKLRESEEYLEITGTFSHFSAAGAEAEEQQEECFRRFLERLRLEGIEPGPCHIASSAALEDGKGCRFDAIRVGRRLFLDSPTKPTGKIREAVTFRAYIADVRQRKAGEPIGYGGRLTMKEDSRVGILSVGFGDGLDPSLADAGIPILYPAHNMHISAGEIDINCYPSLEKHYSDENNYSLAVLIKHHDVNMLFTGDALRIRSEELERIHWKDITLYKVPHHGRSNSQSINLFEDVNPQIAVVTSDECDRDITKAAQNCNSTLLFTRPDGLSFVSDGKTLTYISE